MLNGAPRRNGSAPATTRNWPDCSATPGAATGRYRAGEIDAYAVDETIHHYHRAAAELWKFCFARGGGTHAEFTAGLLGRMTAGAEAIDWQERATPRATPIITTARRSWREYPGCHRSWPLPQRLSAQSRLLAEPNAAP
jgi:hypothetical protein